jgi:NADPH:quinone reductase-like Zn-dependent oxidoreductase
MQPEGVITSFGNAGGAELNTTVMPFILRGVRLLGVNANSPMPLRETVWEKIAGEYRPRHLPEIARVIGLAELPDAMARMLRGETRGRMVIHMAD